MPTGALEERAGEGSDKYATDLLERRPSGRLFPVGPSKQNLAEVSAPDMSRGRLAGLILIGKRAQANEITARGTCI